MARDLTPEELQALQAYAAEHGRYWKQALRDDWYGNSGRDTGVLRQIRNTFGPSWLITFTLPQADMPPCPFHSTPSVGCGWCRRLEVS